MVWEMFKLWSQIDITEHLKDPHTFFHVLLPPLKVLSLLALLKWFIPTTFSFTYKVGENKWRSSQLPFKGLTWKLHLTLLLTALHPKLSNAAKTEKHSLWCVTVSSATFGWGERGSLIRRQKSRMWSNQFVFIELFYKMEIMFFAVWLKERNHRLVY